MTTTKRPPSPVMARLGRLIDSLALTARAATDAAAPATPAATHAAMAAAMIETILTAERIGQRLRPGAQGRLMFLYTRMYDERRDLHEACQALARALRAAPPAAPPCPEAGPLWQAAWRVAGLGGEPAGAFPQAMAERAAQAVEKAEAAAGALMRSYGDDEATDFYATLKADFDSTRAQAERDAIDEWLHATPKRDLTQRLVAMKAAESFDALAASGFLDAEKAAVDVRRPEDEGDAYTIDGREFSFHSGRDILMRQDPQGGPAARGQGALETFVLEAACRRLSAPGGAPDPDSVGRYVASQRARIAPEAVAEFLAHAERMAQMARRMRRPPAERLFASPADRPATATKVKAAVERLFGADGTATELPDGSRLTLTHYLVALCLALCADGVLLPSVGKKTWHTFLSRDCGLEAPRLVSARSFSTALSTAAGGTPCRDSIARQLVRSAYWRRLVEVARDSVGRE